MRDKIKTGLRFHDRMGNYYKLVAKAFSIENHQTLYLCQELSGDYNLTVWDLDTIKPCLIAENLYEEDKIKEKPQGVSESYRRAEAVVNGEDTNDEVETVSREFWSESTETEKVIKEEIKLASVQQRMMDFLDANAYADKLEILGELKGKLNSSMLETIAISIDCDIPPTTAEEQYFFIVRFLQTKIRYEAPRRW